MKLVLQIAGGIVLAAFVLFCLNILALVGPSLGAFLAVLFADAEFQVTLVMIAVAIGIVVMWRRRQKG